MSSLAKWCQMDPSNLAKLPPDLYEQIKHVLGELSPIQAPQQQNAMQINQQHSMPQQFTTQMMPQQYIIQPGAETQQARGFYGTQQQQQQQHQQQQGDKEKSLNLDVPSACVSYIIGPNAENLKLLQDSKGLRASIVQVDQTTCLFKFTGNTDALLAARQLVMSGMAQVKDYIL